MSNVLISLIVGAGVAAFAYSRLGRRTGYGNTGNIYTIVGVTFAAGFLFFYVLLTYVIHFKM
jgi:hypothetical protein